MTLMSEEQVRVIAKIARESVAAGDSEGAAKAVDGLVKLAQHELARAEARRRRRWILETSILAAFAITLFVAVLVVTG